MPASEAEKMKVQAKYPSGADGTAQAGYGESGAGDTPGLTSKGPVASMIYSRLNHRLDLEQFSLNQLDPLGGLAHHKA